MNLTYQPVEILVGATWGHRPHNFLAVGAIAPIAPMESAPMNRCVDMKQYFGLTVLPISKNNALSLCILIAITHENILSYCTLRTLEEVGGHRNEVRSISQQRQNLEQAERTGPETCGTEIRTL